MEFRPMPTPSLAPSLIPTRSTAMWQAADNARYLHPFTDHKDLHRRGARIQHRAEGIYMWDTDGNRMIDGLAGLGCVNIGYGRAELAAVAAAQMRTLSFCQSFFETSNIPAIMLAETLCALFGRDLNHVFYASSGSEANETCLKLARHYWALSGRPEKRVIIARENAYHGSTIATASLSGLPPMHEAGGGMPIADIVHIGCPYHYLHGAGLSADAFGLEAAGWLDAKILEIGADRVAAFFAEPLQGAGGAIIPPDSYWPEVQRICRKHDVLLVVDEVVSGFGRTGAWFGSDHFGIERPDLVSIAKGITSAYFPLSATMVSDRIAKVLIQHGGEFYHGFTHSGHPVACAVALENLRILKDEAIIEHVAALAPHFADHVQALGAHRLVGDARACGFLAGLQLVEDRATRRLFDEARTVGARCSRHALRHGLALRAIGDTMALMPPLVMTRTEMDEMFRLARLALDDMADELESEGWVEGSLENAG
jgi:putrescine aminotransferase